jgi:tryptophanyl-tRNA synthetase
MVNFDLLTCNFKRSQMTDKQKEEVVVIISHPEPEAEKQSEDIVTAFDIQAASDAGINYDKLIESYGCFAMTDELKAKMEKLTGRKPHRFLRRNIFFCHRDLDYILKTYE